MHRESKIFRDEFFFSYLTDFSYFPLERNCRKLLNTVRTGQKWTQSEQITNGPFERWCRWLQLFFIDFQLFYFLTRIVPKYYQIVLLIRGWPYKRGTTMQTLDCHPEFDFCFFQEIHAKDRWSCWFVLAICIDIKSNCFIWPSKGTWK